MSPEELTQQILSVLSEERAAFGYGFAAEIDQRLGKAEGYLGRVFRGEVGLQVETLFRSLEALEVEPADFFVRAVGARLHPENLLQRLIRGCKEPGLPTLVQIERMIEEEESGSAAEGDVEPEAEEMRTSGHLYERLRSLDELRFSDPDVVLEPTERLLEGAFENVQELQSRSAFHLLCRVLGTLASLYRVQARFGIAARCLSCALRLSARHQLKKTRVDLLQRTSYLLGDQGEYRLAVEITRQASDMYVILQDPPGIGRALVDRGIMLNRAGEPEAAIEAYESSLEYLPEDAWSNRFSACQGLGQIFLQRGDLEKARHWAARANECHRTRRGPNWLRLVWLRGEIDLEAGDLESAERVLRDVRSGFEDRESPFDLALVSLRLAKALFLAGRFSEVCEIAADMMGLMKAFYGHRVATAAIQEFARAALTGDLSAEMLERVSQEIEKGCPEWGTRMEG